MKMKKYEWTYKEINGNSYFYCGEWYCRCEERRHNGKLNAYWYVGNDDTEYMRAFRSAITAKEFAEKHFN